MTHIEQFRGDDYFPEGICMTPSSVIKDYVGNELSMLMEETDDIEGPFYEKVEKVFRDVDNGREYKRDFTIIYYLVNGKRMTEEQFEDFIDKKRDGRFSEVKGRFAIRN